MAARAPYRPAQPNRAHLLRAGKKALSELVHKTVHGVFLRRRANWFEKLDGPTLVIWPFPAGNLVSLGQVADRLKMLGVNGPTSRAFDFDWLRQNAPLEEPCA